MTKNDFIIPAVFGLILVVIYLASLDWISPPSLTVKVFGKPVANAPARFFNSQYGHAVTDANGTVHLPSARGPDTSIRVSLPDGTGVYIRFPTYGNKTVDIQGPKTITRTEIYYFGIIKSTEESSMYRFTGKQADAIKGEKMTIEELQEQIDRKVEQRMYPAT